MSLKIGRLIISINIWEYLTLVSLITTFNYIEFVIIIILLLIYRGIIYYIYQDKNDTKINISYKFIVIRYISINNHIDI